MMKLIVSYIGILQNVMPLSAGLFKSEHKNPVSQCPPRLHVQFLTHVLWSRVPNHFLKVDVSRISERQGWMIQCLNPLQFMALHIPEENRLTLFMCISLSGLNWGYDVRRVIKFSEREAQVLLCLIFFLCIFKTKCTLILFFNVLNPTSS